MSELAAYQAGDVWWPSELRRFIRLLDVAYQGSRPGSGDPASSGVKTTPGSAYPPGAVENLEQDTVEAHPDMQRCARIVEKYRKRLGRMADDLAEELRGQRHGSRRWRCPDCGRFQRDSARFCDACGHRRETIRTLHPSDKDR